MTTLTSTGRDDAGGSGQQDVDSSTNVGIAGRKIMWLGALCALVATGVGVAPARSMAATAAAVTLHAGNLSFINGTPPATLAFPTARLNGTAQTVTAQMLFDVADATGSAAGWAVTATSTPFTSGANVLPANATTVQVAPSVSLDIGALLGTLASTNVSYPYTLPAATTAPLATKLFNAAASTGLGAQTFIATWSLAIPADAVGSATPYTSTWTFSLVSGP